MIEAELRVDKGGDLRLELGAELRLTKHTEFEWFWNTDDEYAVELIYELNKDIAFILSHEEEFETGLGVEVRF